MLCLAIGTRGPGFRLLKAGWHVGLEQKAAKEPKRVAHVGDAETTPPRGIVNVGSTQAPGQDAMPGPGACGAVAPGVACGTQPNGGS